jgi:hypothetical protein
VRAALDLIEARLASGEPAEALAAFVAGAEIELPEEELRSARRRAMLVLAAGGDPHRELELDSPAVLTLARDLDSRERRDALDAGLRAARNTAAGLRRTSALLVRLTRDTDLAWRAFALGLLADELGDD